LAFKDVKNLQIQGLNEMQELEVTVKPDEDQIFIIRKTGAQNEPASYKLQCFTRLLYESALTPSEFRERGKKTQITDESNGNISYN
jgi:hypothetical protein